METTGASTQATTAPDTKRYYVITDNGDWMELGAINEMTGGYASVYFMSVNPVDDDDFFDQAEQGEGAVMAQIWMDGSTLTYHLPEAS